MEKKLNRIVKKTNDYLYRYFSKEKNTDLIKPMLYGLLPGGKKIRSKILFDVGSIFKINKLIEKKFQKNLKEISEKSNSKIKEIKSNKDGKKT